jgi:hypothetical protein
MSSRRLVRGVRDLPLLRRIIAAAAGQSLYLTGGFLRDRLMGVAPKSELDLTMEDPPALLHRLTLRRGESFFLMDSERDTYRLVFSRPAPFRWVDLTKMRDGTMEGDLRLRDFTVNALALELCRGEAAAAILDPTGGLSDLEQRRLRPCSPRSFRDDPLRVLRGVRFEAALGFTPDGETLRLMAASRAGIRKVAAERVRDEFFQILQGPNPVKGLARIAELELLGHFGPPFTSPAPVSLRKVRRLLDLLRRIHPRSGIVKKLDETVDQVVTRRGLVVLAACLQDGGGEEHLPLLCRRLALGKKAEESLRISLAVRLPRLSPLPSGAAGRAEMLDLFHTADAAIVEAVLLRASSFSPAAGRKGAASTFMEHYRRMRRIFRRPPLLSGEEALARLSVSPGPGLGKLLRSTRRAQDLGIVRTPRGALRWARRELDREDREDERPSRAY